jgi:Tol biopolymer transport system component
MDADGSNMRRLTNGPADCANNPCGRAHPSWSPDGKQLAYQAFAWVDVVNADGTGHRRLWTNGNPGMGACKAGSAPWMPAWSHDGRKIVFSDALKRIAVLNLANGKVVHLRAGQKPSWSPSDRRSPTKDSAAASSS